MHPTTFGASKSKFALCVALLTLLIVAALVISGCNRDQQSQSAKQATTTVASPTPTPTPGASPIPVATPRVGDTIIVIKGSSVHIKFDTGEYKPELDFQRKFVSKDVKLDYIDVEPTAGSGTPTRCDLPDPKSKIIIDTSPEDNDRIRITGKEDKVELRFDRSMFPTCSDTNYNFCNADNNVWIVWVDKKVCKACSAEDKCKVTLHTEEATFAAKPKR